MADPPDPSAPTDGASEPTEAARCPACRGTGRVVSRLGGEAHEVECPWCDGTGRFDREHDAQARRRAEATSAGEVAASPPA